MLVIGPPQQRYQSLFVFWFEFLVEQIFAGLKTLLWLIMPKAAETKSPNMSK